MILITDTIFLDLPITLVTFLVGYVIFRLLFNSRLSLIFRSYSILGCFVYVVLDGKIEMATFYFLSSALLLTSTSFRGKAETVVIVMYYFVLFVLVTASVLLYRVFYGKLLKYVYDNCKKPGVESFHIWINYSLYNVLLGSVHRILLESPLMQLYVLIVI